MKSKKGPILCGKGKKKAILAKNCQLAEANFVSEENKNVLE